MLFAALLFLSSTLQVSDVTVYVFTAVDPSGFTDPLQAQRLDSLAQLKVVLDKRKTIAVVEQAEGADLTIEVLQAGKLETGNERTKGLSTGIDGAIFGTTTKKETKPQVQAMLRAGSYQLEIHGTASYTIKRAAEAVADGVEKWIKQNRKLLDERKGSAREVR